MNRSLMFVRWLSCAVLLLMVAGCSKSEPAAETAKPAAQSAAQPAPSNPGAANTSAPSAAPAGAPMATPGVIASAQYSGDPDLRADLLEVRRNSGGSLTVKWRVVNTAGSGGQAGLVAAPTGKDVYYTFAWNDLYYIDPAENKRYNFLKDAEGKNILDVYEGTFKPGQQRLNWAKFPAPPASSKKVTISLPKFAPFEDVPVAE
ncbi:MAG: hypothetical protein M3P27_02490 [Acidobacteriota bacterium]|nr:hypothetical protein [Acidobacteriota bacterium]